ncbi:unnamed protein product [Thlaspi arvense]|uniref:Uncharacterized protein n=1 Tax=Thlaspi arvense TaxID=13288 RepID=A0AAU9SVV9_THLAR|nr:unnamed protein product [Thlaspi arvense]
MTVWVTTHEYHDSKTKPSERYMLRCFTIRNLTLHQPLIIKSLGLKFITSPFQPTDITWWVNIAVSCSICKLSIAYSFRRYLTFRRKYLTILPRNLLTLKLHDDILLDVPLTVCLPCLKFLHLRYVAYVVENSLQIILSNCPVLEDLIVDHEYSNVREIVVPSSLYTHKSLVTLKLEGKILVDVPCMACLPSLKTLHLQCMRYSYEGSNQQMILSNFPVLEELLVKQYRSDNVIAIHVNIPFLKILSGDIAEIRVTDGFVIDCSLRYFKNMPKLEEADLDVLFPNVNNFLEAFTSRVKAVMYSNGILFDQIEHLKLCTCEINWSTFMVQVLKESHKLRVLKL